MNGHLNEHPLGELIREISDARLSGALRLARERVRGVVYFADGRVVSALTNLRAFSLVEVLRRGGAAGAERLAEVAPDGGSGEEAGAALVRAGLIDAAGLSKWRARQSAEVLRALLAWADGEWAFDPRVRLAADAHAPLDTSQLLVESARALPAVEAARRMSDAEDTLSPAPADSIPEGVQLLPVEAFVLSRVGGATRLSELLAVSGLPEAETLGVAYTLALGGLLARERWPRVFKDELPRAAATHAAAEAVPRTAAPPEPAPESAPAPEPAAEPQPSDDPRTLIEELFELSRKPTHYEVLGVARSVRPDEIKRAYYSLAKRLHPDHFRRGTDEPIRQQIDASFAKVTQAYEVLKDARLRAAYDMKLPPQGGEPGQRVAAGGGFRVERAGGAHDGPSPALSKESAQLARAEEIFQQGLAALQKNDVAQARRCLGEAALLVPRQARYRAYYGRALARDKSARRQSEAELQAAIMLDERNPSYHVMLAELYQEHGLRRRAEGELERALRLDPAHAAARRLLEQLRRG
jgi:curved DNA-binding protein CbpA